MSFAVSLANKLFSWKDSWLLVCDSLLGKAYVYYLSGEQAAKPYLRRLHFWMFNPEGCS